MIVSVAELSLRFAAVSPTHPARSNAMPAMAAGMMSHLTAATTRGARGGPIIAVGGRACRLQHICAPPPPPHNPLNSSIVKFFDSQH